MRQRCSGADPRPRRPSASTGWREPASPPSGPSVSCLPYHLSASICDEHTRDAEPSTAPVTRAERRVEDLLDLADPHEVDVLAQVLGDVLQVSLVPARREHAVAAGPLGC